MVENLKKVTDASTERNVLVTTKNIAAIKITNGEETKSGYTKFSLPKSQKLQSLEHLIVGSADDENDG